MVLDAPRPVVREKDVRRRELEFFCRVNPLVCFGG